jgi:hypothetical protein
MDWMDRIIDESRRLPKVVDPGTHAALDYLTVSAFLLMSGLFWGRHRRAAATALINAGMVLGVSMLTNYPGGLKKISLRAHAKADIMQMLAAAGLPSTMGFGNSGAALPFRLQALNEALVISVTDFDNQGTRQERLRRAA